MPIPVRANRAQFAHIKPPAPYMPLAGYVPAPVSKVAPITDADRLLEIEYVDPETGIPWDDEYPYGD